MNELQKKIIDHKKTSPLKNNKKKTNISQKSSHVLVSSVEEKLKSPKNNNSKTTKRVMFAPSVDDNKGDRKNSI